jgi:uncharacterized repeat protein (TIGR01451 family)/CSLREA domain-containing protein
LGLFPIDVWPVVLYNVGIFARLDFAVKVKFLLTHRLQSSVVAVSLGLFWVLVVFGLPGIISISPAQANTTTFPAITIPPAKSLVTVNAPIIITTPADDATPNGNCTLREAVIAANTNAPVDACAAGLPGLDVIIIPTGIFTLVISGPDEDQAATGDLDIREALVLNGQGVNKTIIDGAYLDRIFEVFGVDVTLTHLTIRHGANVDHGGGIFNTGNLKLVDVVIRDNQVYTYTRNAVGGGIDNAGTLQLVNSVVVSNTAGGESYDYNDGGGIHSSGILTLTYSTVAFNRAESLSASAGGGIFLDGGQATVLTSTIKANTAVGSGAGGGLYNHGGTVVIIDSQVINNQADKGAGLFVDYNSQVQIAAGSMADNSAVNYGGGIYNLGSVIITAASLARNVAGTGGAIKNMGEMSVNATTIRGNQAQSNTGGGIFNEGNLWLINSTLSTNTAAYAGGGLDNAGGAASLTNTTVADNNAMQYGGDGLYQAEGSDIHLQNTLLANVDDNCLAVIISHGHNLVSDGSCAAGLSDPTDLQLIDPRLGPLQNNGGPTQTHAPAADSPAIDTGLCLQPVDQRGRPRPGSGSLYCDIGAVERAGVTIDLALTKQVQGSGLVRPGQSVTYTLAITNLGPATASSVILSDTLSVTLNSPQFFAQGVVITRQLTSPPFRWDMADLLPGQSGVVTITAVVSDGLAPGIIIDNVAEIFSLSTSTDTNLANNRDSASFQLVRSPGIVLIESGGDTRVAENGVSDSYSLALTSPPSDPVRVDITTAGQTMVLPNVLTFTIADWSIPQVVNVFAVDDTVPEYFHSGLISNTTTSADHSYDNRTVTVTVIITDDNNDTAADLVVVKSAAPDPLVVVGQKIRYAITVTNQGPWPVTNVLITDTLPVFATAGLNALALPVCGPSGNLYLCQVPQLSPGELMQLLLEYTPPAPGQLVNRVVVSANEAEISLANNAAAVTSTVVTADVDLAVRKRVNLLSVIAGEPLEYTVVISNSGPDTAFGVIVTDHLPPELDFQQATISSGYCNLWGSILECGLSILPPNRTEIITITAVPTVTAFAGDTPLTNTVSITASVGIDRDMSNNTAVVTTTIAPFIADLSISKTVSRNSVQVGQPLTYTMVVTHNNFTRPVHQLTLVDWLPPGLEVASIITGSGVCYGATAVFCTFTEVPASGVSLALVVTPTVAGVISNTAQVATIFAFDPDLANNTSPPAVTTIMPLGVDTVLSPALTYTLTITAAQNLTTEIFIPADALTRTIRLEFSLNSPDITPPPGWASTGRVFSITAYSMPENQVLPGFVFSRPITLTLTYTDTDLAPISDEAGLRLYYATDHGWADAATTCTPPSNYQRNLPANQLAVAVCHLTQFALLGPATRTFTYLPVIIKDYP